MNQQTDKTTALYYRVASKQPIGVFFDNQMQKLLCYANEQGLDGIIAACRALPKGGGRA